MDKLPLALQQSIESGECVLFVGAGIGANYVDQDGRPVPNGRELAQELAEHFSIDCDGEYDLPKIAQVVEIQEGRPNLEGFIRRRLANLAPDDNVRWITGQHWQAIYTTNYDRCIQIAYEQSTTPSQNPVTISATADLKPACPHYEVPIIHLHGTLFGVEQPRIVLTENDYAQFRERRRMLFEMLKKHFITSTILYIGYSNEDPNWKVVLDEMFQDYYPSKTPISFRIAPNTSTLHRTILLSKNIQTLDGTFSDFIQIAAQTLRDSAIEPFLKEASKKNVPSDLLAAFERHTASVLRLCNSWDYVKQVTFTQEPNITAFLKGDRPNWALVGQRYQFERDIEADLHDALVEFAADDSPHPRVCILLAPAGYGVTTLLASLSVRIVESGAQGVFSLKPGKPFNEADVEFACSIFPERPIFIVDNAAEHSQSLYNLIHRFREAGRPVLFMIGSRLNEWREGNNRVRGKEFEILPLSDAEIDRLLDCLERHSLLGALEDLSRLLRFDVIKTKHEKQLIVTLREAIEGGTFEAILESEYRGITNDLARRFYLLVCFVYQFGIFIRDDLIADLLGVTLEELHKSTADWTAGVVIYEEYDSERGKYAARARHRIIAEIVWDRCADLAHKSELPLNVLEKLNLNYSSDKEAFDAFVQSDQLVDSIGDPAKRIQFFDSAIRKDPRSPYVRQHYARMLGRLKSWNLALEQIDKGLDLGPDVRVLYHTKGLILKQIALEEASMDLARKRLVQSQNCFEEGLRRSNRDEFSHHGLAELFFDWAKRVSDSDEILTYISKAEDVIEKALKVVHRRDRLLVVSADINEYLGNAPGAVHALERAVNQHPDSIIARYLLGRRYRKDGKPDEAIAILDPVIHKHFDEFRSFLEYALSRLDMNDSYASVAAILALSTHYGFRDAKYVATYAGCLFMDGNFTAASQVIREGQKAQFAAAEERRIFFKPKDRACLAQYLQFKGKVVAVKAGYSFFEVDGYPAFFCPGSKLRGVSLERGMSVTFEPSFTARGHIADNVIVDER